MRGLSKGKQRFIWWTNGGLLAMTFALIALGAITGTNDFVVIR